MPVNDARNLLWGRYSYRYLAHKCIYGEIDIEPFVLLSCLGYSLDYKLVVTTKYVSEGKLWW